MYDQQDGVPVDGAVFGVAMPEQKLESFKIGDKHKPRVSNVTAKKEEEAAPPEATTLGFARIEGILDNEAPGAVAENLARLKSNLSEREAEAKSQKERATYKRARIAVERTQELLDYLFQTKAAMIAAAAQGGPQGSQGPQGGEK